MNYGGNPSGRTEPKDDLSIILNLLNILENLFFSMKIPSEISQKYNLLKESAFKQITLSSSQSDNLKMNQMASSTFSRVSEPQQPG